ncbi:chaperonin CPN60-2, mitochondrial-like isoform X5 [Olea europaea var. sylvestris]|uniref:chaperonin CPN60-2, mitochondrial-like isoform X5 n=1 Tax=Olea europaea var. sylvestris TaxID=158386 RepID=UPI000C1CCCB3|nr:chaperonin CPN60-2, mitochondrial-like isoform X5 [Olea europaea var. sylvestris]
MLNKLEIVDGMKFDRDHISPFFMTNQKNLKCRQRCVVIVAEEVESDALATLILNKLLARIKLQRKSQMVQNELVRLGERITKALSMELCHEFEDKFL